jgi:hypothetical protein
VEGKEEEKLERQGCPVLCAKEQWGVKGDLGAKFIKDENTYIP